MTIQGARSRQLLFWTERLAAVSDQHIITTDDGSAGRKGLVTEPLQELLEADTARADRLRLRHRPGGDDEGLCPDDRSPSA